MTLLTWDTMTETKKPIRIFMSAAEPSGERHCANLIKACLKLDASIEFVGIGGPKMEAAGCHLLENTSKKASMLHNAVKEVVYFWKLLQRIKKLFRDEPVDLVIVCDSPSFNFHVAKAAKKAGTQTMFYVAPQLWAWAAWRIHKLKRCCDKLCCILPFEEAWFKARDMDAVFVSNPLLDGVTQDLTPHIRDYTSYDPNRVKVGLMPGSRSAEIDLLWKPIQEIAIQIKQTYPQATFTVVAADDDRKQLFSALEIPGFECEYAVDSVRETALRMDFCLVTSGSATVEVATVGCPMIVMYKASRLGWHLAARWLIKTPYMSLVNILANRELVPEFMPYFTSIDPLVDISRSLIQDPKQLAQTSKDLIEITQPLAQKNTADTVARIALDMVS
jgi:lipid-A-disaccharide synthase